MGLPKMSKGMKKSVAGRQVLLAYILICLGALISLGAPDYGRAAQAKGPTFAGNGRYIAYANQRFGYAIEMPAGFQQKSTSDNGDGATFVSNDGAAELAVWGGYNIEESSARRVRWTIQDMGPGAKIALKTVKSDWYVLSWLDNGIIYYEKMIFSSEIVCGFRLSYSLSQKQSYDAIVVHLEKTLRLPHQ